MKRKQFLQYVRLIALSITLMTGSSLALSQTKVSDFDKPVLILPKNDHLNVTEAEKMLNENSELVLLDVRKQREYDKEHIPNAIHADYFSKDFNMKLAELDKDKPYVVYCKSGTRSDETVRRMNELGITQVSIIGGGFRAWRAAGKETVMSDDRG